VKIGEKNPGMCRVMVGDALVFENDRLHQRMNQFFDRIESALRQVLRSAAEAPSVTHSHSGRQRPRSSDGGLGLR